MAHLIRGLQVALLIASYTTLPSLALQALSLAGYACSEAGIVAAAAMVANAAVAGLAW